MKISENDDGPSPPPLLAGPLPRKPADISSVKENKQKTNYQQLRLINISVSVSRPGCKPQQRNTNSRCCIFSPDLTDSQTLQEDTPAIFSGNDRSQMNGYNQKRKQ